MAFGAGDDEQTFTFMATQDSDDDDGESVKLTFGMLPAGVSAGSPSESTVSITDDDDPGVRVSFGSATYAVVEGETVTVTVGLSADPERTVVVPIAAAGQGGAGSGDYSGVPASVTFASGETSKTFTFMATQDTVDDDDESVKLTFGQLPAGVSAGTTAESVVPIDDDDRPTTFEMSFGSATNAVTEGGTVTVTVSLTSDAETAVTVPLTATPEGGATSGDYSGVPSSVAFGAGDDEQTFTFMATQDSDDDDGESVKLTFGMLPAGVSAGSPSESVVSITDDDDPGVRVSFGSATYAVVEGETVTVTVGLSADPERTVVVPITAADQGGAGSGDYSGVPASVTLNSGDTSKTFTFMATEDTVDDDDESVKLTFGQLPAGVSAGTTAESVVSIDDDRPTTFEVSFGSATYTVAEGGTVTVTVSLTSDAETAVTVPLTATPEGGATSGDYSGVPSSVAFGAGDDEQTFTFMATQDSDDDDGESVKLTFGMLPAGVSAGSPSESTVSITDDDDPGVRVSFGSATYGVVEGETVTVTVGLSADPERTVVVPITAADQGGAGSGDYSGVPASVTFNSGDTSKTFTFMATEDTVDDDDESVKLTFGQLPAGVSAGSPSESVVSIDDDDRPTTFEVSFGSATYTVAEGGTVTVTVSLTSDAETAVTVPLTATPEGGATSGDYSGVPSSVAFGAGDDEQTFTFMATQDSDDDDGESVKLTFGMLPAGVSAGSPSESTVSITDDDDPGVRVSFGSATYGVVEGETVTVTVGLSADPERTVVVPITAADQGGAGPGTIRACRRA